MEKETNTTTAKKAAEKKPTEKKAAEKQSVFATLSAIDCGEHTEIKKSKWKDKKGVEHEVDLTYLSWAWAWHICKQNYPDARYTIYENENGRPYFDDGRTCWVKTGVTIEGQEHIEYLPIMDYRNLSIPLDMVTSMDMNKAIQRSLTKALARHGLGLYIYAGEDLPWTEEEAKAREEAAEKAGYTKKPGKKAAKPAAEEAKPAGQGNGPAKPEMPARGSENWNRWVAAIATGAPSKTGQKVDWMEAFKANYAWEPDMLACLEEDVFNYRVEKGIKAGTTAQQA